MHIGLLSINNPRRGLWRDAEAVLWALREAPVRHAGQRPASVSLFAITDYSEVGHTPQGAQAAPIRAPCPEAVPEGTRFSEWLRGLDVLVTWEKMLPGMFAYVRRQGVRLVYVPHVEWCQVGGSVDRWAKVVRTSGCEVWAKTEQIAATFRDHDIACELVPWSIPDPVVRQPPSRKDGPVTFLINAGMGGWRNRRGVDLALQAYALALQKANNLTLILKTIKPLRRYVPDALRSVPHIEEIEGFISREALGQLQQRADAVLYPSRWEGFGLSLLEALHAGLPVLATDGWPMNELVEHGHNGLLARATRTGQVRLSPHWECDPESLAEQMLAFARDDDLRRRLSCPAPAELVARQHHFRLKVRQRLLQEPPARIVIGRPARGTGWRRSEEYWADALQRHGYHVEIIHYEADMDSLRQPLSIAHDFVLVSKAPVAFLRRIRQLTHQPIVLWHHDTCRGRGGWMQSVSEYTDLLCVPESNLEDRIDKLRAPVLRLMPGAKVDGDRGPGRRPITLPPADVGPDLVFLGNNHRLSGNRNRILLTLARHVETHIYGRGWRRAPWHLHPPIWSKQAAAVNRSARVTLSVSATPDVPHYTSNRLFNSCGAGACVMAEAFPGLDDHYPPEAVARFCHPQEAVTVARHLLADRDERQRMRALAEDHTWRHHTWDDRIIALLEAVRRLPAVRTQRQQQVELWEMRARHLGVRAVGYYRWDNGRFEQETRAWWQRLWPYLERQGPAAGARILDFGCGAGRFSTRLDAEGYRVAGVDISPTLLRLASATSQSGLTYLQITPGESLPFADHTFDALWVCTALQHISAAFFPAAVNELKRILRPQALVLLCENTEQSKGSKSTTGHVTFRRPETYISAFPGITPVDSFTNAGERHTVFIGRLGAKSHDIVVD